MKALTAYENTNMYGGAHTANADIARKAAREGRGIVVHANHYDGQRDHCFSYRVSNLNELPDGRVTGTTEGGQPWEATYEICEYAQTGKI